MAQVATLPDDIRTDLLSILGGGAAPADRSPPRSRSRPWADTMMSARDHARAGAGALGAFGSHAAGTLSAVARYRAATVSLGLGGVLALGGIAALAVYHLPASQPSPPRPDRRTLTTAAAMAPPSAMTASVSDAPPPGPVALPVPPADVAPPSSPSSSPPSSPVAPRRLAATATRPPFRADAKAAPPSGGAYAPSAPSTREEPGGVEMATLTSSAGYTPDAIPAADDGGPSAGATPVASPTGRNARSRQDAVDTLLQLRRQF